MDWLLNTRKAAADTAYTRDLALCWRAFSQYYPDKSADLRQALQLAMDHHYHIYEAAALQRGFGACLTDRAEDWLDLFNPTRAEAMEWPVAGNPIGSDRGAASNGSG